MNILGKEKQASKADVERLCRAVEGAMNQSMTSPTDFDRLAEAVFDRLHVMISSTTLKRMWGYLPHDSLPTRRTLNTLSLFVGFTDFDQFLLYSAEKGIASSPVLSSHVDVREDLAVNAELTLYWYPDRVCSLRYLGDSRFMVTASLNTRLHEGDTFCCNLMIEGEPLYLSQLVQGDNPPVNYVCGKMGGIHFQES